MKKTTLFCILTVLLFGILALICFSERYLKLDADIGTQLIYAPDLKNQGTRTLRINFQPDWGAVTAEAEEKSGLRNITLLSLKLSSEIVPDFGTYGILQFSPNSEKRDIREDGGGGVIWEETISLRKEKDRTIDPVQVRYTYSGIAGDRLLFHEKTSAELLISGWKGILPLRYKLVLTPSECSGNIVITD